MELMQEWTMSVSERFDAAWQQRSAELGDLKARVEAVEKSPRRRSRASGERQCRDSRGSRDFSPGAHEPPCNS